MNKFSIIALIGLITKVDAIWLRTNNKDLPKPSKYNSNMFGEYIDHLAQKQTEEKSNTGRHVTIKQRYYKGPRKNEQQNRKGQHLEKS